MVGMVCVVVVVLAILDFHFSYFVRKEMEQKSQLAITEEFGTGVSTK